MKPAMRITSYKVLQRLHHLSNSLAGPFFDPNTGKEIIPKTKVVGLLLSAKSKARMKNTSPDPSARYSSLLTQGAQKFGFPGQVPFSQSALVTDFVR